MFSKLLLFYIFIICAKSSIYAYSGNLFAGEQCTVIHNGYRGICTSIYECYYAFELYKYYHIRPTSCGFERFTPIICCPESYIMTPVTAPAVTTTPTIDPTVSTERNTEFNSKVGSIARISQQKCNEYKQCEIVYKIQVVGGVDADPGEFPHMAALGWPLMEKEGYAWNCGASLISDQFIITAAHCTYLQDGSNLKSSVPTIVRLGKLNIQNNNDNLIPQDISIDRIILHPQYKPPQKYHDVALIRLTTPASFNDYVKPICLWQTKDIYKKRVQATGWGRIGTLSETSDVLQKVDLNIVDVDLCNSSYKKNGRILPKGIIDGQLCVGDLDGGKDTCQGDSGGPIQITDPEVPCAFQLIGITSFGIGCGGKNTPAIYTRISSYIDWIESVVWA